MNSLVDPRLEVSCPTCKQLSTPWLIKNDYILRSCCVCQLKFVSPAPSSEFLAQSVYSTEAGYGRRRVDVDGIGLTRFHELWIQTGKTGKFFDVGCAAGRFMFAARRIGLDPHGCELNRQDVESAWEIGLTGARHGAFTSFTFTRGDFIWVHLGDVLEHQSDPLPMLKQAVDMVSSGGWLTVSLPNIECKWSKWTLWLHNHFQIPWSTATPPYHLVYFGTRNLDALLAELGFHPTNRWFTPPKFRHELGCIGWTSRRRGAGRWKKYFAYIAYAAVWLITRCFVITGLDKRDAGQQVVYVQTNQSSMSS